MKLSIYLDRPETGGREGSYGYDWLFCEQMVYLRFFLVLFCMLSATDKATRLHTILNIDIMLGYFLSFISKILC